MMIGPIDIAQRVMVIAEIGVNHDGSVDRAIELVRAAAAAGADAVKVQVFVAERLMHPSNRFAAYQVGRTDAADPVAMLKQYELTDADLRQIAQEAARCGLLTVATPFSPEDVPRVVAMGAAAIKIASPDLVNMLLLDHAYQTGLPLLVSTGASTLDEVKSSIAWLDAKATDYVLLHCVSSYPTSPNDANLNWIMELGRFSARVGYSDHTDQIVAGALAVAHGACVIEKHLTYDTNAAGPDHSASFEPGVFAEYVRQIRLAERMRGKSARHVLECEKDVRTVSRQGLVLKRDIADRAITRDDLTTQRPGPGVPESLLKKVIGAMPSRPLKAGQFITENDLA